MGMDKSVNVQYTRDANVTRTTRNEDDSCSSLCTPPSSTEPLEIILAKDFYFGFLSVDDCEEFLVQEGDFLVRCLPDPSNSQRLLWIIAVKDVKGKIQHIPVTRDDEDQYVLMKRKFPSLVELVHHYHTSKEIVVVSVPVVLRRTAAKPKWMLTDSSVTMFAQIGKGQGGSVWAGTFGETCQLGRRPVAIKYLHEDANPAQVASFEKEARIHRRLSHSSIVQFVAIVIDKYPVRLVTELCDNNLKIHLKKNASKLAQKDKIQICLDVSEGLEYLIGKGYVHRDIAARNCLMKQGRVRITDLGLAVRFANLKPTEVGPEKLPIKTTAPEGLICKVFSEKSDVWAFGVLMWEVFTGGAEPYEDLINRLDKRNWGNLLVANILAGYRMPIPLGTPKNVESVIKNCWQRNPVKRPTFHMVRKMLSNKSTKKWYQRLPMLKK
uniref:Tyrosine-protein kinase n=1 Tax=Trichuris muris TaxID=70415 RepID=A0A5S6QD47_TRIMR